MNKILAKKLIKRQQEDYTRIKNYDFVFAISNKIVEKLINDSDIDKNKIEVSNDIIPGKFQPIKHRKQEDKK